MLYKTYLQCNKINYTFDNLKPLIERVYKYARAILMIKYNSNKFSDKQIEDKAIELTVTLCTRNKKGIPVIIEHIKAKKDKKENSSDFEYLLFLMVRESIF